MSLLSKIKEEISNKPPPQIASELLVYHIKSVEYLLNKPQTGMYADEVAIVKTDMGETCHKAHISIEMRLMKKSINFILDLELLL